MSDARPKKIGQLKAGVLLSYVALVVELLVSFLYTPVMVNLLGQSEYGTYNYVFSVVNYLTLFSCGFGSAYIRFYTRYKVDDTKTEQDVYRLNGMFLSLFTFMGVIVLIVGMTLSEFSDSIFGGNLTPAELSTVPILMRILVLNIFVTFLSIVFNSFIITHEKFVYQKLLVLLQTILKPVVTLPILYIGYRSIGLAVGTLFISFIILVINICYCVGHEKMRFRFDHFDINLFKEIAVFSSFLLLSMIVDQINWSVDKYILGKLTGTVAVAIYSIGAVLNTYYKKLSEYISNVFVPRVNRLVASDASPSQITDLFIKIGRIQFYILALICTGFLFFGKPFIVLWVGPEYEEAYYITLLLMIPVTVPELQKIGLEILKAKNLHKFRSIVYFFIAIINVVISIPLCKMWGGIGCALGTAITVLLGNGLVINIYYYKKADLDVIKFWKNILGQCKGLILPAIIGALFLGIDIHSWWVLFLCVVLYAIVYCVSCWFFSTNMYERNLIKNML